MSRGKNFLEHLLDGVRAGKAQDVRWSVLRVYFLRDDPQESWRALREWAREKDVALDIIEVPLGKYRDWRITISPKKGMFPGPARP